MSAAVVTDANGQAPKFSRYRSVRKAVLATSPEDVPPAPVIPGDDNDASPLNRAPSRYHRATRQRTQTLPTRTRPVLNPTTSPAGDDQGALPNKAGTNATEQQPVTRPVQEASPPPPPPPPQVDHEFSGGPIQQQQPSNTATPRPDRHLSRAASAATHSRPATSRRSYEAAREEARMILEGEYDRLQKMKEEQAKCASQKKAPDASSKRRPTVVRQPRPQPPAQPQPQPQPQRQPAYVDAPNLNVKMKIERTMPEKFHDAPQSIGLKKQKSMERQTKRNRGPVAKQHQAPPPPPLLPPSMKAPVSRAAPVVPAPFQHDASKFDAPVSAVNAGDRRVEVRLNNANRGITLPVTPTTNSKDLLNSASIVMSEDFDPRTCILVESFSQVGLERPLRRYEHIRDVMNSWDSDDQNHLTIMTESECQATGLERNEAPETPPAGMTMLQMHLSLRPGKWDKRWVILRPDGQVTMSKHENDGEGTNICHLSDFDVYTPTTKQKRKLRPPKKICFAIKSQQKSAMFLEGVNFVHFFATGDKQVADQWYTAVQTWRSWYLVHVLGEGVQKATEPVAAGVILAGTGGARPTTAHSTDSVPYQLGSFQPLLDFDDLDFRTSLDHGHGVTTVTGTAAKAKDATHAAFKKPSVDLGPGKMSFDLSGAGEATTTRRGSRQRGMPPSSYPPRGLAEVGHRSQSSQDSTTDQAFTGGGLLGRSMSTRRSRDGKGCGPGVPGKPLLDLTPTSEFAEGSLLRRLETRSTMPGENEVKS